MEKIKLFEARKSKGFSQSLLAERINMDTSSCCRREKGQKKIVALESLTKK
jgi:ribosome-binding protein aMBF1 (putative translation factor)